MNRLEELDSIIVYCEAARRAKSLGLCKLLIKEEIQPRAERLHNKEEAKAEKAFEEMVQEFYPTLGD